MALSITGRLKLDRLGQHEKAPELDMETAIRYSRGLGEVITPSSKKTC
jgi:hypothetical protein